MWWSIKLDISCFRITVFHFLCRNRSFTRMKAVCVNTGVHNLLYRGVQRGGPAGLVQCINTVMSLHQLLNVPPGYCISKCHVFTWHYPKAGSKWRVRLLFLYLPPSPPLLFPVRKALPQSTHTGLFLLKSYCSGVGHRKDGKGTTGIFSLRCGRGLDQEGRGRVVGY